MFKVPEKFRLLEGSMSSMTTDGNNGVFLITVKNKIILNTIASDKEGWEHVSVSVPDGYRTPKWHEMSFVKFLFWSENDCVMQLHPPKKNYINNHPHCLHLWRPIGKEIPQPHWSMVGIK